MKFIELTIDMSGGVKTTFNAAHIIKFNGCRLDKNKEGTEIFLTNSATTVKETYEEVKDLLNTIG